MQVYGTNDNNNDPFYEFINKWCLPIGFGGLVIGVISVTPTITYIGLCLMFTWVMFGDISD